ncbi:MAG TPA: NAD-binding protein [Xanthobacteraceae bacterium]|jgi:voltage-gated potassium channel Kch|nr:NAD-binding protein [Xanthobacteraceae bacterium]
MDNPLLHPSRNLFRGTAFMAIVWVATTLGYMRAGWNFQDAFYMVTLTVFTVGYGEVRPIDTPFLHALTIATMVFGCTGMIFLSGALVQFMTLSPLQQLIGGRRMQAEVDKLDNHIIVCGYGRIGIELAKALKDGRVPYVVVEQNEQRVRQAREAGHSCLQGDATNETTLLDAGIGRARALASVLPNDAANVFITLSARNLNAEIEIIARGDAVSTERKLIHAGANKVVLPTHIGAERIAEILLFPETSRFIHESGKMRELEKQLRNLGLVIEVVVAPEGGALTGLSIEEIEARTNSAFFVIQVNRRDGDAITGPEKKTRVEAGDGVVVVGRSAQAINALFAAPRQTTGRSGRLR